MSYRFASQNLFLQAGFRKDRQECPDAVCSKRINLHHRLIAIRLGEERLRFGGFFLGKQCLHQHLLLCGRFGDGVDKGHTTLGQLWLFLLKLDQHIQGCSSLFRFGCAKQPPDGGYHRVLRLLQQQRDHIFSKIIIAKPQQILKLQIFFSCQRHSLAALTGRQTGILSLVRQALDHGGTDSGCLLPHGERLKEGLSSPCLAIGKHGAKGIDAGLILHGDGDHHGLLHKIRLFQHRLMPGENAGFKYLLPLFHGAVGRDQPIAEFCGFLIGFK